MKGVVEEFFEKIGMQEKETYDPNAGKSYLHPGRRQILFMMEKSTDI